MSTDQTRLVQPNQPVMLDEDALRIRELAVDGTALAAARAAAAAGRDLEVAVRQMLEVGGAVLLHGSSRATVDAVGSEVDRLLTALSERSDRLEAGRVLRKRIAAKGLDFEDLLAPALDGCFAAAQDVLEVTGATPGIADDKTGDFVVTLNQRDTGGRDRRIVIEAKDRRLSMPKAMAELDAGMLNRDAQVAVMVFASAAQAPLAGKPIRALPGNRIVCVLDKDEQDPLALEVACQMARTLALNSERQDLGLDRTMLADRMAKLINVVERASAIQRAIRTARRGLDDAENAYQAMTEDATALLYELEDRLGD